MAEITFSWYKFYYADFMYLFTICIAFVREFLRHYIEIKLQNT